MNSSNDTILESVKRASNGKQSFMNDSLFMCLLALGVILVAGTGIAGNISVLLIIKRTQTLQNAQNYLLANLAAADITSLMFCCFSLIPLMTLLPDGVVGTVLCTFFVSYNVSLTATVASVFTLTILAIERG